MQEKELIAKIKNLPPDKLAELIDFVDFLAQRDDRLLVEVAAKVSEPSFNQVWENADDAAYDQL